MGQAKARGSYEQRQLEGMIKATIASDLAIEKANDERTKRKAEFNALPLAEQKRRILALNTFRGYMAMALGMSSSIPDLL